LLLLFFNKHGKLKYLKNKNKNKPEKVDQKNESTFSTETSKTSNRKQWLIPSALILTAVLLIGYFSKNLYTVAIVNGQPIYRYTLIKELEKQNGKQLLDQKITEALILDKASKENITIPEDQIDQEISKIETQISAQGQELNDLLAQRNMDRETLRKQIRIQKLIEALLPKPTEPTDEEIMALVEKQADSFPKEMNEEDRKTAVKNRLTQQQQSQSIEKWLQSLRDSANIQYLINY